MPSLILIFCTIISLIIAFLILIRPLFLQKQVPYFDIASEEHDFDESLSLLETIKDLDTDFQNGKITKEDYDSMSLEYKREFLDIRSKVKK